MEIRADVLLKATSVDGIYTADPKKDPDAVKFETITYMDIIQRGLRVMDTSAVSLCNDNRMPMIIFSMREQGNIVRVVSGEQLGTLVVSQLSVDGSVTVGTVLQTTASGRAVASGT